MKITTKQAEKTEYAIHLRRPHAAQLRMLESGKKRIIVRAGRRGGKTVGVTIKAVEAFLAGKRVLYAAPTQEQVDAFWWEIRRALEELIDAGKITKNETMHMIEVPGTRTRIRAKTAWNADTLRGDWADLLILDEWQLMNEEAWALVGAPMLLDNDGSVIFVYTPPSLHSRSLSKARDPLHAAKLWQQRVNDPLWDCIHFTSQANPYISEIALTGIVSDMTALAYRQEIMAEDVMEAPGALWTRGMLDGTRVVEAPALTQLVIGVDPPGGAAECGIVAVGRGKNGHLYVIHDASLKASPDSWAGVVIGLYQELRANSIVAEKNYGGDMVESTIRTAAAARGMDIVYRSVDATRGKAIRAEPIAALFEQGRAHLVGNWPRLEDELAMWTSDMGQSPNRLDAMVWAATSVYTTGVPAALVTGRLRGEQGLVSRLGW